MSLGGYNPYDRYRNRSLQRLSSGLTLVAVIVASMSVGFWLGRQRSAEAVLTVQEEAETLRRQSAAMQETLTQLRADARTAELRYRQLQEQYAQEMPAQHRELIALVREQLSQGMDPQRLAQVVRSARPPKNCAEPETKRFVALTPAYKGPGSSVAVAEGDIVITGSGASARSDKGDPEAWYDPAQPVEIIFNISGGLEVQRKSGILPLHHSVMLGEREYRFTFTEGARSFIKITLDSCDY